MKQMLIVMLGLAVAGTGSIAAQQMKSLDGGLVPLIGLWRAGVEGGEATYTIDGTAAPKPSDEQARSYFGANAPSFLAAASSPTIFPLAAASSEKNFTGGVLRVEFKLLAGATDQTAGIAFNLKPDHSYMYARYNTKDGNVALWKYERGERTVIAHGELHEQLPFGVWHILRVITNGREMRLSVNEKFLLNQTIDRDVSGRSPSTCPVVGRASRTTTVSAKAGVVKRVC